MDFEAGGIRIDVCTTKNREGRDVPFDVIPDLVAAFKTMRILGLKAESMWRRYSIVETSDLSEGMGKAVKMKLWPENPGTTGQPQNNHNHLRNGESRTTTVRLSPQHANFCDSCPNGGAGIRTPVRASILPRFYVRRSRLMSPPPGAQPPKRQTIFLNLT